MPDCSMMETESADGNVIWRTLSQDSHHRLQITSEGKREASRSTRNIAEATIAQAHSREHPQKALALSGKHSINIMS